jgi:uncharacterized FAD-dependent dehydrogenase
MGKDPYKRQPDEVMSGFMGCGLWSDGKLTYHTSIGGQLSKYCGEDKAYDLMDQVIEMVKRFHPKPEAIMYSNPLKNQTSSNHISVYVYLGFIILVLTITRNRKKLVRLFSK